MAGSSSHTMSKRRRWSKKPKGNGAALVQPTEAPIVAICIPSDDHVHAAFMLSILHLTMHTFTQDEIPIRGITAQHIGSSILPHSRYTLVKQSARHGATHLLYLDSDMTFPADTLVRLLRHDKDMVSINAMSRRPPYNLTGWVGPGEQLVTTAESTGLVKVWRTGLAVALIKASVFDALDAPYFEQPYLPEKDEFRGEDYHFFDQARKAGFELYIDQDLSKQVNHLGSFAFNPMMKDGMQPHLHAEAEVVPKPAEPANHEIREGVQPNG